jgi:DsbC/DsbD-like thiol-disulfide interchange protein
MMTPYHAPNPNTGILAFYGIKDPERMQLRSKYSLIVAAAALISLGAVPLQAALSPWSEGFGGKMRLVAGGSFSDGLKAGLEIEMEPGWKT